MKRLFLYSIILIVSSCSLMENNKTRVIFLGDSITQQGEDLENGFISLMRQNISQNNFELIGKGISGNKVSDLLARYKADVISSWSKVYVSCIWKN